MIIESLIAGMCVCLILFIVLNMMVLSLKDRIEELKDRVEVYTYRVDLLSAEKQVLKPPEKLVRRWKKTMAGLPKDSFKYAAYRAKLAQHGLLDDGD